MKIPDRIRRVACDDVRFNLKIISQMVPRASWTPGAAAAAATERPEQMTSALRSSDILPPVPSPSIAAAAIHGLH